MDSVECEENNLVLDSCFDGEPVKFCENGGDVVLLLRS